MRLMCIDGTFTDEQKKVLSNWPSEGEEYTVREEVHYPNGKAGYRLVEVVNPPVIRGKEPTFRSTRFVLLDGDVPVEIVEEELDMAK